MPVARGAFRGDSHLALRYQIQEDGIKLTASPRHQYGGQLNRQPVKYVAHPGSIVAGVCPAGEAGGEMGGRVETVPVEVDVSRA
jgi:hypothetical protein